ncbi:MAG TPA: hypothetical protein VGM51_01195 [Armatimonadota bacterium]|jgi:hypothetical protein
MTGGVAFVASNDAHVVQFAPVMQELERRGVDAQLWSLDCVYNQGVTTCAASLGIDVGTLAPGMRVSSSFYRRPVLAVWRDVLRCRRPFREWIDSTSPDVVVVGNDRGLVEKLILNTARHHGARVVLVQDGVLAAVPPRPVTLRRRFYLAGKGVGSKALRLMGFSYMSASRYGEGGADVLCASGPQGASVFRRLGVPADRIRITGQPRFDGLSPAVGSSEESHHLVVAFTTPFADAGIGADLQDRQTALLVDLARELRDRGIRFRVKRHPRESPQTYADAFGDRLLTVDGSSGDVLRKCAVAVVGMSTVTDEAGLSGVPVVVPGQVVHAGRLDHHLPPADCYPRFESAPEGAAMIASLLEDDLAREELRRRQQEAVSARIFVDPERSASLNVADAICSVMS